ncbi:glycosyltransferase [Acuticoccus kandeliae]|uniref:glycosyltransferase n=1 Tax=Acuticoccus kandeliae TaxID=2073160 RepID=UPI000D3E86BA|nr:glycosyltransferase [Acuticoccus kandeliae]
MTPSSDADGPPAALAAFAGRARIDAGIAAEGPRLAFPADAAWLTVALDRRAGTYRLSLDLAAPAALRAEILTTAGPLPLRLAAEGPRANAIFALSEPLTALRLLPVEGGTIEVRAFDLAPAAPWVSMLPDWNVGPLRLPPRADPAPAAPVETPASWDGRVRIEAAEAVTVDGERMAVGEAGVLRLRFDPPLEPGAYRFAATFLTAGGEPALVEPRLLADGGAASPLDTLRILRPVDGRGSHAGFIRLDRPTATLLLRPREQRGDIVVRGLRVERQPLAAARHAVRLAARDVRGRAVDWLGRIEAPRPRGRSPESPAATLPSASIVVATRDAPHHLSRFLASLANTPEAHELILVDNGTTDAAALALLAEAATRPGVQVIRDGRPFNFAALSNLGARAARGEILVFANNDLEFVDPGWLAALLAEAMRPETGLAGARLLYPDGRVQHAGLVLAGEARVRHAERFLPGNRPGHAGRQRETTRVAGVTGALMALRRELFFSLGCFDSARFGVLYNDIDLCLRAHARGLENRLVPESMAVHHESASIGRPRTGDLFARGGPVWRWMRAGEADAFRQLWGDYLDADPCYPEASDPLAADFRLR